MGESSIVKGILSHTRYAGPPNTFQFKHVMLLLDLKDLEEGLSTNWILGYNKLRLMAIKDKYFIDSSSLPLRQKLQRSVAKKSERIGWREKILVLTTPAIAGYSFNPASFYIVITPKGKIRSVMVEVHNTFGESHIYYIDRSNYDQRLKVYLFEKRFHVSPFLKRTGEYQFNFSISEENISLVIDLFQNNKLMLKTKYTGSRRPMSTRNLLVSYPIILKSVVLTEFRILLNAWRLYVRQKAKYFTKPAPMSGTNESAAKGFISKLKFPFL